MLYVNGQMVTEKMELEAVAQHLKEYLYKEKLIIVKQNNEPMLQEELASLLKSNTQEELHLSAMHTSVLLREFKEELENYIKKVEIYIEDMRETENFSDVLEGFVQVTEALLEFSIVERFLQKRLINKEQLNQISNKALARAEDGNYGYVLDLLEYELLSILHHLFDETNEVM